MKKLTAILLILLVLMVTMVLSACDQTGITVESVMNIDEAFAGTRTVSVLFPLSANIDSVKDTIVADFPAAGSAGANFEYKGVVENGYLFELNLTFSDRADYESKVSAVIGREASACLSQVNTVLTKGTRMTEDFDTEDMIRFVERACAADSNTATLSFDCSKNTVSVGGQVFNTGSTIDISEREGSPVSSISIDTVNLKDGMFDRTITFTIPNATYNSAQSAIEEYFKGNVAPDAQYSDWSKKGENVEFSVIYKGLDIDMLAEYTANLLSTGNVSVFYGDKDNASTPLSEGLTYEERFDTFAFLGESGAVPVYFSYSLPTETTHGDGSLKIDGSYKTTGEWVGGVYSFTTEEDAVSLRIPDGIQYLINGINFTLESEGEDTFKRTTEFLYSKTDGYDGMAYARNFFQNKGADVSVGETDTDLVLTVVCEGTTGEITDMLVNYFGSGNFMSYEHSKGMFSLSDKTTFRDYVNIGYMLNSSNATRPMTYTVVSSGEENIVSLSSDTADTIYKSPDTKSFSLPVEQGVGNITYRGNIPDVGRITLFVILCVVMLGLCLGAIAIFITISKRRELEEQGVLPKKEKKEKKKKDNSKKENRKQMEDVPAGFEDSEEELPAPSLTQTTTFSIAELGILKRNKKYVDEINKDVEERLEADRLENLKKEIKAKEIAEMGEKVYGKPDQTEEKPQENSAENASEFFDFPSDPVIPEAPAAPKAPDFSALQEDSEGEHD